MVDDQLVLGTTGIILNLPPGGRGTAIAVEGARVYGRKWFAFCEHSPENLKMPHSRDTRNEAIHQNQKKDWRKNYEKSSYCTVDSRNGYL